MKINITAQLSDAGSDAGTFEVVSGGYYEIEIKNIDVNGNPIDMTGKPVAFLMRRSVGGAMNDFEFENITAENNITRLILPSDVTAKMNGTYYFEYGFKQETGRIYRTVFGRLEFAQSNLWGVFNEVE